jgi:uncharacterized membrane protein SpoIIM required for sporulation
VREAAFVKQNQARWQEFEKILTGSIRPNPDKLSELFIQITDDLSFARTQYPKSRVTKYLNNLASKIHLEIYKNKRESRNKFVSFWRAELPLVIYQSRKQLFYSFLVFMIAGLMGVISTLYDDTFVRLMLGDYYVNMTLENIAKGDPTGVYASSDQVEMFFGITFNNVMVSFYVFAMGIFSAIGSAYILFDNAIRIGSFITFFYVQGQLAHGAPIVMLHGTIELTSIVIAGAAGFVMGNSFIFPNTFSRLESFKQGALKGLKMVVGLVPFFIVAGFIESFITRYSFMHWSLKMAVIGMSAFIMIYYFIFYPFYLVRNGKLKAY